MSTFPGLPQKPNWRFQYYLFDLIQEWIDHRNRFNASDRLKPQWLDLLKKQMIESEWPQQYILSVQMAHARLEAETGHFDTAVELAIEVGNHEECGFYDWGRAMDLVNLYGSTSDLDQLKYQGVLAFASRIDDQFIYSMVRRLLLRPSHPDIHNTAKKLINKLEVSMQAGRFHWSHAALPLLKGQLNYRKKKYAECLENLQSKPFESKTNESLETNGVNRVKPNLPPESGFLRCISVA